MEKMNFYKRFSYFILFFFIISVICMIGSIYINIKDNQDSKDCTQCDRATLSSCLNETSGSKTKYYGVYTFEYNDNTWTYIGSKAYSSEEKVPSSITIYYNEFTNANDMKVHVDSSSLLTIPFVYFLVAAVLMIIFVVFRGNYKDAKVAYMARQNINHDEEELDEILNDNENQ